MKKIIIPVLTLFLTSCTVSNYYQVFKTSIENGVIDNNKIVFEDNNCQVYYNLWSEGGNVGFSIYNKTEKDLTVNLSKTYFVINNVAYEYFQNRTFSKSSISGAAISSINYPSYLRNIDSRSTVMSSTGFSTSYLEKPELTIPPKTLINIAEYIVTKTRFATCDLEKFPYAKDIKTLRYNKENSPFVFYNLITYSNVTDTVRMENKFFVSEITNFPSSELITTIDTSACGKRLDYPVQVIKNKTPDRFFIRY